MRLTEWWIAVNKLNLLGLEYVQLVSRNDKKEMGVLILFHLKLIMEWYW